MRGRKPKPNAIAIAEGDPRKRGVHKLYERMNSEPQAKSGLPRCPRHLRGRARASWNFWRTELESMELDKRPDAMMLEGACVNYARAVEADLIIAREGLMVEESVLNDAGEKVVLRIKYHPAVTVSNAAWRQVRAFCSEFGLSPVSRMRLPGTRDGKRDLDLLEVLSKPREKRPAEPTVQ